MAADFEYYEYLDNEGNKRKIRMAVTSALGQTTAAILFTTAAVQGSVMIAGNRNRLGVHARGFRLKRSSGTGVNKKSFFTFLPVTLPADWNTAKEGAVVTVAGLAYTISSKVPEKAV